MPQKSNFYHDLGQEQILGRFLDQHYQILYPDGCLTRVSDKEPQNKGIDLIYTKQSEGRDVECYIDEKAQLTYLNKKLPTFAFELSYLLNGAMRAGWLFDQNKVTTFYFLITEIFTKDPYKPLTHEDEIQSCVVTKVHRQQLIAFLSECEISNPDAKDFLINKTGQTLTTAVCDQLAADFREYTNTNPDKEKSIKLNDKIKIYCSTHLNEQPVNVVINLKYLINNVAFASQRIFKRNVSNTKANN